MSQNNSLANNSPDLVEEWHPTKNGNLSPQTISAGSDKKVWWKCKKYGHEWEDSCNHRTRGRMCPYCSNRRVLHGFNDLQTTHPQLAIEWHPTKNGELTPQDVTAGSDKKVWWKCQKHGHEWEAYIYSRSASHNCPYCCNKKVLVGFNDLATVAPHLAAEWHPTKNGKLTPQMITTGSNKKVWRKCKDYGHEWQASIAKRAIYNRGCPYCTHQKVLVGYNDLASRNPKLAAEWHPTKNGTLTPYMVMEKSNKKVWWQCAYGHEWEASISSRSAGSGCPYDAGKKVLIGFNDLETVAPQLASEWHPTKNGTLTPKQVTTGSPKKVWWKCKDYGHEWQASIASRKGCPYCSNQKVLPGFNDLETTEPNLAKQWHPTKNGNLLPSMVTAGSNKKVWWQCEKGHTWQAPLYSRLAGTGCPECTKERQTSFPEQAIFYFFQKVTTVENRAIVLGKEVDIWLPELRIGIEYNGGYWHNGKEQADLEKRTFLTHQGIRVIVVKEGQENHVCNDEIEYKYHSAKKDTLNWVVETLFTLLAIKSPAIDVAAHEQEIYAQYIRLEKENSLAAKYPSLVDEWHPTKNGNLLPSMVTAGSNKKVWWRCQKCGHEWVTKICHRTIEGSGCPKCNKKGRRKA